MNLKNTLSIILGILIAISFFLFSEYSQIKNETTNANNAKSEIVKKPSFNSKGTTVLQSDSSSIEELEALRSENKKLLLTIKKLEQQIQFISAGQKELSIARGRIDKLHSIKQFIDAQKPERKWLDKEIEESYPAPFDDLMKDSQGVYREMYQDFQYEPIDSEWAFRLETHIRDFIQLSELASLIEITVLNCKSYRCQLGLIVKEKEGKPWKAIFDQMTLEPWFKFTTYHSSPVLDESFNIIGNFFFMQGLPDSE